MHTGSRLSLSLRGVTIHNNSHINIDDIGGNNDQEALLCHTDNVNCCTREHTDSQRDEEALGEWYYGNGSMVSFVDGTIDNDSRNDSFINSNFFASSGQSVIRLFYRGSSINGGKFCCRIPDKAGLNHVQCVHIGKNYSMHAIMITVTVK